MKIKVMIVDDEMLERILILKSFDWELEGFEIIGEASDGAEALEFCKIRMPDIIITDINMPHIDGVELAEKVKNINSDIKIIMITGHQEFEYARKALKIGVEDYLLKPINSKEIKNTMSKIKDEVHSKYSDNKVTTIEDIETRKTLMNSFLQRLVENKLEPDEIYRKLKIFNIEKIKNNCICMNIRICNQRADKIEKIYMKIVEKTNPYLCFMHYMNNIVFYFSDCSIETVCEFGNRIKNTIIHNYANDIEIGISDINKGIGGIAKAYDESKKAIDVSVILGRNICLTYNDYLTIKSSNKEEPDILWKDIIFHIENGMLDKVDSDVEFYCQNIKNNGIFEKSYIRLMAMDMVSKTTITLSKRGKNLDEILEYDIYELILKIDNIMELEIILKKILIDVVKYINLIKGKRGNSIVEGAIKYIDLNIYNQELSLKKIAKELFINESYLSRVFKKENGESTVEYITKKRINCAIELLKNTDMKVYEIAEKVGFSDAHYFGICFKKYTGMTIKEYKKI